MNSKEHHRIREIESFAYGVDHSFRNQSPYEEERDGRPVLLVGSFKPVRPIWLCVRLLAKMLVLGLLIFDKLDSIEEIILFGSKNLAAKDKEDAKQE